MSGFGTSRTLQYAHGASAKGRTLPFDASLSNGRYRFLSPVSCHSAFGQLHTLARMWLRSAVGRYVHMFIATPMHSTQLCTAARRTLVACADLLGLAARWVGGELDIVLRDSFTAIRPLESREPLYASHRWPRPRAQGDTPGKHVQGWVLPSSPELTFCGTPRPAAYSNPIPKRVDIACRITGRSPFELSNYVQNAPVLCSLTQRPRSDQSPLLCIVGFCA